MMSVEKKVAVAETNKSLRNPHLYDPLFNLLCLYCFYCSYVPRNRSEFVGGDLHTTGI